MWVVLTLNNYLKSGSFTFSVYSQDTNFWGAVHGTQYAIPHLKNSKGRIIVVASGCGWFPLPRLSIYNVNIDISSFQNYRESAYYNTSILF